MQASLFSLPASPPAVTDPLPGRWVRPLAGWPGSPLAPARSPPSVGRGTGLGQGGQLFGVPHIALHILVIPGQKRSPFHIRQHIHMTIHPCLAGGCSSTTPGRCWCRKPPGSPAPPGGTAARIPWPQTGYPPAPTHRRLYTGVSEGRLWTNSGRRKAYSRLALTCSEVSPST